MDDSPISDAQAKTVACPTCGARKDRDCIYVPVPPLVNDPVKVQRVGSPTRRVHNERRAAYRRLRRRHELPTVPPPNPVLAALHQLDLAEHRALRGWLAEHGTILLLRDTDNDALGDALGDALDDRIEVLCRETALHLFGDLRSEAAIQAGMAQVRPVVAFVVARLRADASSEARRFFG